MSPAFASGPCFFISYSRADTKQQRDIVTELRVCGVNTWVDIENLIPDSPEWEREIERNNPIRGASGIIALLSPDSNNSEWARREVSFAEETDSIPLRLSSHQRVDFRHNHKAGLDQLADNSYCDNQPRWGN